MINISALHPGNFRSAPVLVACALLAFSSPLAAQTTYTWDNGTNTSVWGTSANWVGDPALTFNNRTAIIFNDASVVNDAVAISIGGAKTINSLTINADFFTAATNGSTFDIRTRNGLATNTAAANLTFDATAGNNASITVAQSTSGIGQVRLGDNGGGSVVLNTNLDLAQHNTFFGVTGFQFETTVSGVGTINKTGLGEVRLVRQNTNWSGGLNINEGNVTIAASPNAMGTGTWTIGGGTNNTSLSVASAVTYSNVGGLVVAAGAGTRTIRNYNAANQGNPVLSGAITLNKDVIFDITAFTNGTVDRITFSGAIGGTGGIIKTSTGILILSASNNYSGTTDIQGGKLYLAGAGRLGSGAVTISNVANVDFATGSGQTNIVANNISGAGLILQNVAGTDTRFTGDVTSTGGMTINTGTVRIGNSTTTGSYSGDATVASGAALAFARSDAYTHSGAIYGAGNVSKTATGEATLTASNSYSGVTTLFTGTLVAGHANALGTGNITFAPEGGNSGSIRYTAASAGTDWASRIVNSSGTVRLDTAGNNVNLAGAIDSSNTNGLTKSGNGTLTFGGANAYTGGTTIDSGTLQFTNGGSVVGNITNNAALSINRTDSSTLSNAVSGTGGLTKSGAGTAILTGANTFSGGAALNAGTLRTGNDAAMGTGAFAINGGVFASDSATARTITNAITMGGNVQLGDATGTGALTLSNIDLGTATRTLTVSNSTTVAGAITNTGGLTKDGAGTLALAGSNTYSGGTTISAGTLELANGGSLVGNIINNAALSINRTDSSTLANAVSGSGALTKSGSGTATLTASNTYSGGTTISAGTLELGNGGSVAGAITNNATLSINRTDSSTVSNVISGAGALTKSGAGTAILAGANTFSGGAALNAGTLRAGSDAAMGTGAFAINGGVFASDGTNARAITNAITMGGNVQLGDATGTGALTLSNIDLGTATRTLTVSNSITTLAGAITNTGGLTKDGAGDLVLAGASSYTGATTVNAGRIAVAHSSALGGTAGGTVVANGAQLLLTNVTVGAEALTINGAGFTSGPSLTAGALRSTGTNTWGGKVTLGSDATIFGGSGTSLTLDVASGEAVDLGAFTLTIDGAGVSQVNDGIVGTGGVVKAGSGTMTLTAANSFSGTTVLEQGRIILSGAGRLGSGDVTLNTNANRVLELAVTGTNTMANNIGGAGRLLSSSGETRFTGAVTNAGGLTITNSTVRIGNGGTSGSVSGPITNNASLVFDRSDAYTHGGTISGNGSVTKSSGGSTTLTASNTYTGTTTVSAGKLVVNGSISSATTVQSGATLGGSGTVASAIIDSGGTIDPGNSPGTITFTNGLTWLGGGNYDWQIFAVSGTAGATNTWDLISVTGGTWDITGLNSTNKFNINLWSLSGLPETSGPLAGFNASTNYSWKILDASAISGSFNTNLFNINTAAINGTGGFVGATGLFSLAMDGNNDLFLTYTGGGGQPIPEPGTWAAAVILAVALFWRRFLRGPEDQCLTRQPLPERRAS